MLQLRALHPRMLASPHLYGYPTTFMPHTAALASP
jgi:hypothetical protein